MCEPRERPSRTRPPSAAATPTRSAPVSRGPPIASTAIPAADAACTSESGASASAADVETPAADPGEESDGPATAAEERASECSGRRSESAGSDDGRVMLQDVAAVDRGGGCEAQQNGRARSLKREIRLDGERREADARQIATPLVHEEARLPLRERTSG